MKIFRFIFILACSICIISTPNIHSKDGTLLASNYNFRVEDLQNPDFKEARAYDVFLEKAILWKGLFSTLDPSISKIENNDTLIIRFLNMVAMAQNISSQLQIMENEILKLDKDKYKNIKTYQQLLLSIQATKIQKSAFETIKEELPFLNVKDGIYDLSIIEKLKSTKVSSKCANAIINDL